jgi:hypothetical protein
MNFSEQWQLQVYAVMVCRAKDKELTKLRITQLAGMAWKKRFFFWRADFSS